MDPLLSVDEQEKRMAICLKEQNGRDYLFLFNLYHCGNANTPSTLFFKSAALLFYILQGNDLEYNKLLQSISFQNINNEFISTVLSVKDSVIRYDLVSLKSLSDSCNPELKNLVIKIFNNHNMMIEEKIKEPVRASPVLNNVQDFVSKIQDCLYVVKNHTEN